MKILGTDFVLFRVSNVETAARFYRETLSLPQLFCDNEHGWAEFDCGNVTLALTADTAASGGVSRGRIALAVADVPAALEDLHRSGHRTTGEPVDYGVCQAVEVMDPDGNTVILHHRADGTVGP